MLVLPESSRPRLRCRSLAAYTCTVPHGEFLYSASCLVFVVLPYAVDGERGGQGGRSRWADRQAGRQAGGASVSAPAVCELSSSCLSVLSTLSAFSARIACCLSGQTSREEGKKGWMAGLASRRTLGFRLAWEFAQTVEQQSRIACLPLPQVSRHPPVIALPGGSHTLSRGTSASIAE